MGAFNPNFKHSYDLDLMIITSHSTVMIYWSFSHKLEFNRCPNVGLICTLQYNNNVTVGWAHAPRKHDIHRLIVNITFIIWDKT